MTAGDINLKIEKCEAELDSLNEKITKKKKEIAALKKKKQQLEITERNKKNERIISAIEKSIGSEVTDDLINSFLQYRKMTQRAAAVKAEDRQAASELYVYAEGGIGCVLMMTDMVYMMLSFLSLTGNM